MSDRGVLDELPILRFLPEDARARVVRRFVPVSFVFGSVIVAEGSPTDALFVLVSGRARVVKHGATGDEIPLNVLRAGDSFGEAELLDSASRPSTVRASSDVLALRLDADEFRRLVDAHPDTRTYLELQAKHARLQTFFRNVPAFARLPPEAVAGIVLAELEPVTLGAEETVYRHGDPAGPLYLVEEGRVRVLRHDKRPNHVATLGAGESFGVVSALRGTPRMTTVEAITAVRLFTLSGETLDRLGAALPSFRAMLDEWVAQHDFRNLAQVPSDIEQEILRVRPPSAARVQQNQAHQYDV